MQASKQITGKITKSHKATITKTLNCLRNKVDSLCKKVDGLRKQSFNPSDAGPYCKYLEYEINLFNGYIHSLQDARKSYSDKMALAKKARDALHISKEKENLKCGRPMVTGDWDPWQRDAARRK